MYEDYTISDLVGFDVVTPEELEKSNRLEREAIVREVNEVLAEWGFPESNFITVDNIKL